MKIVVRINGEDAAVDEGVTVARLVEDRARDRARERGGRGLAVAVNGEVVPRSEWASTQVAPDDAIELLNAVGGG